jgi:hypothetical protein
MRLAKSCADYVLILETKFAEPPDRKITIGLGGYSGAPIRIGRIAGQHAQFNRIRTLGFYDCGCSRPDGLEMLTGFDLTALALRCDGFVEPQWIEGYSTASHLCGNNVGGTRMTTIGHIGISFCCMSRPWFGSPGDPACYPMIRENGFSRPGR